MDKFKELSKLNNFKIYGVEDSEFIPYGRIIDFPSKSLLIEKLSTFKISSTGCTYEASRAELEIAKAIDEISPYFGCMDIQIGYCSGANSELGAMEWHDCNEVNVAIKDCILFLGSINDFDKNNHFDTSKAKAFYFKQGQAVVVNARTLHYAPAKVSDEGFSIIVALEKGTNLDLSANDKLAIEKTYDEFTHFLANKNKYLITHKELKDLVDNGIKPYVVGENLKVKY
ncbi:MAG: DUF4867 family protein [Spirochaetaceae bacterium]|nr:DUF4867 family protein [Spirochaetaceae bacterium]